MQVVKNNNIILLITVQKNTFLIRVVWMLLVIFSAITHKKNFFVPSCKNV